MVKLGSTPDAHPPDNYITAQFLAVAEWPRLVELLKWLFEKRLRPDSYGWFVTTALDQIHDIKAKETSDARAMLRLVRRGGQAAAAPEPEQLDLMADISAIAAAKAMR